jgi:Xaa-Pro aminopeptidase
VSAASIPTSAAVFDDRVRRAREAMARHGVDVLLLSVGSDLPYLTGYSAMPLERLTMLVVPADDEPTLVIPRLEAPRVVHHHGVFAMAPWDETDDPIALVTRLVGGHPATVAVGDTMWSRFLVELLAHWGSDRTRYVRSVEVMNDLRLRKDAAEVAALAAAGAAVDRIAAELQAGRIPLVGRTEAEVSADLGARIVAEGHELVNFAIVAAGANAASPHHHPGDRVIADDEIVLCDFGGTMAGYCSDITRCVYTGATVPGDIAEAYDVLFAAQAAGVAAGVVGAECQEVDRAARRVITDAGFGEFFVHRTGHGIGMEAHEDPYMVEGNGQPIEAGHAFSVEPGIYVPGRWGMRLEDIVVATDDGPRSLNHADHRLIPLP